jgi:hypothetical protein
MQGHVLDADRYAVDVALAVPDRVPGGAEALPSVPPKREEVVLDERLALVKHLADHLLERRSRPAGQHLVRLAANVIGNRALVQPGVRLVRVLES